MRPDQPSVPAAPDRGTDPECRDAPCHRSNRPIDNHLLALHCGLAGRSITAPATDGPRRCGPSRGGRDHPPDPLPYSAIPLTPQVTDAPNRTTAVLRPGAFSRGGRARRTVDRYGVVGYGTVWRAALEPQSGIREARTFCADPRARFVGYAAGGRLARRTDRPSPRHGEVAELTEPVRDSAVSAARRAEALARSMTRVPRRSRPSVGGPDSGGGDAGSRGRIVRRRGGRSTR
jgi:hypothetical protein